MRIVFATLATYHFMSIALTERKAQDRLLSFYLLKNQPDVALRQYVETGISYREPKHRARNWKDNRQAYVRIRKIYLANRLMEYEKCLTTQ